MENVNNEKLEKVVGGGDYVLYYELDGSQCFNCGICLDTCLGEAIILDDYYGKPTAIDSTKCILCGNCVWNCPAGCFIEHH